MGSAARALLAADRETLAGYVFLFLSITGSLWLLWAALLARRLRRPSPPLHYDRGTAPGVTILKPLFGAEPRLLENLESFLDQDYDGPIQLICGVHGPDDPAVAVFEELRQRHSQMDLTLVCEPRVWGSNPKVSNLANMAPQIRHGIVVMSDSDMHVPRNYLSTITEPLVAPDVGAVSCLYHGRGDSGLASRLVAMGISQHFLPAVLIGRRLGMGDPCMGSTIALRRETLDAIGGFPAFADVLADDHAIGEAVRKLGLRVTIPDMVLTHCCTERRLTDLWRQEVRWNVTIRDVNLLGYCGGIQLHPFPLALVSMAALRFSMPSLAAAGMALAARSAVASQIARASPAERPRLLLVALRDLLSFAVFFCALFARSVDWRGARLRLTSLGRVALKEDQVR